MFLSFVWFILFISCREPNQLNEPKKPDEPNKPDEPARHAPGDVSSQDPIHAFLFEVSTKVGLAQN